MSNVTLTPPEVLTPPQPVHAIAPEKAFGLVPIAPDKRSELDRKVDEFVAIVVKAGPQSPEFRRNLEAIHGMASDELKAAVAVSNRMMERPVRAMNQGLFNDKSPVASALIQLRNQCEELDPSRQGDLLSPRKLLGLIPFGNRLRDYFQQYESAQSHINATVQSLLNGRDELLKDNIAVEQERGQLWELMGKLEQYVYVGQKIDEALEQRLLEIESQDPEKARVVKEDMLFYVRQKRQDLLTNLAVNVQTYLSLDLVRKNNLELVKGVDRATTTTIQALRNAVMTAQALANQRLVLDQVKALNATTSQLIESTSAMLKQQGAEIAKQAMEPAVALDSLKKSFVNIYEAIDTVNNYKVEALAAMKTTITELGSEIEKAKTYMEDQRRREVRSALSGPSVEGSGQAGSAGGPGADSAGTGDTLRL